WFNRTSPDGKHPLPALIRAGMAHFHFVSIHPFEDGNGRIARALSEKILAQSLKQPTLIALSHVIEKQKKDYYGQLNKHNHTLDITSWLNYFSDTVLGSIQYSQSLVDFLISKAKLYDQVRGQLNPRQEKALARMFKEGLDGFKGGLSAENYIKITQASRATATRDLQKLVELGALTKTGTLKSTRYGLNV
ncbi:MAG: Fic family protein, partial [Mariprofundaceae bacterium]|nr:Fic family protein [Mariprofundaceae bacterium]